ncbi:hypothetical protein lam_106 [Candidatus Liberibacter americanus str. Sao Paulo]|uniref:Uncharacterized protein n=1 Tax=Candidatus Liberibacter americanus str. Sao Paulo TaxID=1261131 RepID=U6B6J2_9HYPH|nr:hypothetical protein lam_106 [Candidatus Liberibacter americanus str. Sao Paulo]
MLALCQKVYFLKLLIACFKININYEKICDSSIFSVWLLFCDRCDRNEIIGFVVSS